MNILIYTHAKLPVLTYGGTERVVWDLVQSLCKAEHSVTLLAGKGTVCDWAKVIEYNPKLPLDKQIPGDIDIVHFHVAVTENINKPYVFTQHWNSSDSGPIDPNTIFVSSKHAKNHGAEAFVYNGLNWDNYVSPDLSLERKNFHFLGKAAWSVKNVRGAIDITRRANEQLQVLGGFRLNFKKGFRCTFDRHVRFMGMVDDTTKAYAMSRSKGLVFPVTWHEPFGLAVTESMYFGCPIFSTPYGSLPEIVQEDVGVLSNVESELVDAVKSSNQYDPRKCHEFARDLFNADVMAKSYLNQYEKVLNGFVLNSSLSSAIEKLKKLPYYK